MHRTIRSALLLAFSAGSAFAQAPARPPTPPQPPAVQPGPAPGSQAQGGQSQGSQFQGSPSQAGQAPGSQAPGSQAPGSQAQAAQSAMPHAWLFGAWTGGLFPAPVTLNAQECLANPSVIFTRDTILRAVPTDVTYSQILVESARAIPGGAEFRLSLPATPAATAGAFGMGTTSAAPSVGFGCENPAMLRVQRRGEDQIAFPSCSDFPYPLVRCPSR